MKVYGPVQLDCVNDYWQVVEGHRLLATFLRRKDALAYVKKLRNREYKKVEG